MVGYDGAMDADLELLERWRAGDRAAGTALFARHFPAIYRFFEHKVPGEADELAQRTFAACVAARDAFRGQSSFRTYLYAIARNELFAHLRRLAERQYIDFEEVSLAELATSPSGRAARAQQADRLRDALRELPTEQQLVLELHYWHDLGAAELAEVLGTTPGNIRVRLNRARQALRQRIGVLDPQADARADDRLTRSLLEPEGA
jgi:RNA polymerase sigma-70 factor (ECF subfamily)